MIGQTLNKRYRVTALIGEGAMGEVYRATDSLTRQEVAVKVITQKLAADADMLERFRREGEALRKLRHANIVAFGEMFPLDRQCIIVMEYVPGGSLHRLLKGGPLSVARAVRIALELSDALTRAHHIDIIHRDVKPENVLMADDGTPKLTDFGVARLVGEKARLTGTGTQIGTPFYMSPEAWEGKPLDAQADIWSLGVMLYEMLTGQVPFGGDTLVAVMNKVLTAPLPDLRAQRPETAPALAEVVGRMLMRNRAERYRTMRQVAVDLESIEARAGRAPATSPVTEEDERKVGVLRAQAEAAEAQPTQALRLQAEARRRQEAEAWQAQEARRSQAARAAEAPHPGPARAQGAPKARTVVAGAIGLFLIACLLVAGALGLWATGNTFFPRATPSSSASATAVSKPAGSLATSQPAPLTATLPPTTETPRSTDTLVAPTDTPVPPTPTFTSAAAAAPATFTSTPEPPASASTPLPKLEIIAPQNLDGLHQLAQWMDTQSGDAAFSPDSRSLAGANRDIAVVIWDSLTGQKLHSFSFSPWWISGIIYSPDGKTLAVGVCSKTSPTGCAEADVLLLDIATGQVLHTLTGHVGSVEGLAFSPDGKTLATGSIDSTIRLWDVATGQRLHSLTKHTYAVSAVAFSPDGKTLASASGDKTVRLWDPATGQLLRTLQGHTYWVYSVAYSPDGKMLASGSGDLTVRLWDPATGQLLRTLKDHGDGVNGIAFSPDGKLLASVVGIRVLYSTSHDSFVRLWDPATGQLLQKIEGPPAGLRSVSFSPDGKMLVAAVWDYTIRVWGVMK